MNGTKDSLGDVGMVAAPLPDDFEIKAFSIDDPVNEEGEFSGYAAHFNNLDHDGDIILPGAFAKALRRRKDEGDDIGPNIETLWMHDARLPIGRTRDAKENEKGLWFRSRISMTTLGKDALILLRDKVVRRMSFGYRVTKSAYVGNATELAGVLASLSIAPAVASVVTTEASKAFSQGRGCRLLIELDPWEISPVSFPANDKAIIEAVKSRGVLTSSSPDNENAAEADTGSNKMSDDNYEEKAGRVLSAKNLKALKTVADNLKAAADTLLGVIKAAEPASDDEEQEAEEASGKAADSDSETAEEEDADKGASVEDLETLAQLTKDFVSAFH